MISPPLTAPATPLPEPTHFSDPSSTIQPAGNSVLLTPLQPSPEFPLNNNIQPWAASEAVNLFISVTEALFSLPLPFEASEPLFFGCVLQPARNTAEAINKSSICLIFFKFIGL